MSELYMYLMFYFQMCIRDRHIDTVYRILKFGLCILCDSSQFIHDPVSYTHLSYSRKLCHIQPGIPPLLQMSLWCRPHTRTQPVSYTHLDVYKRQVEAGEIIDKLPVTPPDGKPEPEIPPVSPDNKPPVMLEGDKTEVSKNPDNHSGAVFRSSAPLDNLIEVKVDEKVLVKDKDYTCLLYTSRCV